MGACPSNVGTSFVCQVTLLLPTAGKDSSLILGDASGKERGRERGREKRAVDYKLARARTLTHQFSSARPRASSSLPPHTHLHSRTHETGAVSHLNLKLEKVKIKEEPDAEKPKIGDPEQWTLTHTKVFGVTEEGVINKMIQAISELTSAAAQLPALPSR